MASATPSAGELDREIIAFISRAFGAPPAENEFNTLALSVFRYQFEQNRPYRAFCRARGATPGAVARWEQIPAVPVVAFKEADLACESPARAQKVFVTSGTTRGAHRRGRHFLFNTGLYDAAAAGNFKRHVLPDRDAMPWFILAHSPEQAPDSSLTYMLDLVRNAFGAPESRFCMSSRGLECDALLDSLTEAGDHAVGLLATSYVLLHWVEHLQNRRARLSLPPGSRIMDTGGFKGRARELPRVEFLGLLQRWLGVPPDFVVNEYGMTEMTSQFYDNTLRLKLRVGDELASSRPPPRHKVIPPWVRVRVVSPETLEPVSDGEHGLLVHYDLANRGSVLAIQTEDLGMRVGAGFEVLGRVTGAEARGCSLAAAEFLASTRG